MAGAALSRTAPERTPPPSAITERQRYSLGTKNKNLRKGADGSLTLYVGAKSPGADKEWNWSTCAERPLLALHPRLLGPARHSRRLVEAAGHPESQLRSFIGKWIGDVEATKRFKGNLTMPSVALEIF